MISGISNDESLEAPAILQLDRAFLAYVCFHINQLLSNGY